MRNKFSYLLKSFCLLVFASSVFAAGVKHPSDYGEPPNPIDFTACGSTTVSGVVADCFEGTGESQFDFLFTLSLQTPTAATSITSAQFTFADVPSDVGFLEGIPSDCVAMNIACTPAQIGISNNSPPYTSPITLGFSNFAGDLTATVFFAYDAQATAPVFTGAATAPSVATPEPGEIAIPIAAFGCLILARRKLQA
jgi:hypothetical protein